MKGSTDPHSSSALLAAFGAAVLDINRLARDKTLERFHHRAGTSAATGAVPACLVGPRG